jgi:hypothetical protein
LHTAIQEILSRCGTDSSVLPPTELFNEGWMLRLVLDWFDRNRDLQHELAFEPGSSWYSEALLPSRFLPTFRGDPLSESYTHADGLIGHFTVQSGVRGDAVLDPDPRQFIVIEAKLGSALSTGTKNAPSFDQAARNVACMAHMIGTVGVHPSTIQSLAFYVIAPANQIETNVFGTLVTKDSIHDKVAQRVASYDGRHDEWFHSVFLPTLEHMRVEALSWERIFETIPSSPQCDVLKEFYSKCLHYSPLRVNRAARNST